MLDRARVVFVDAWTSLGGAQFLDSPATGRYHTYLCDEIVPWVDARYRTATNTLAGPSGTIASYGYTHDAAGNITFANSTTLCGDVDCDADWNPQQNLLALVSGAPLAGIVAQSSRLGSDPPGKEGQGGWWPDDARRLSPPDVAQPLFLHLQRVVQHADRLHRPTNRDEDPGPYN